MGWKAAVLLGALAGTAMACRPARSTQEPLAKVVDSLISREEALARFRDGVPAVTALETGSPSPDALVRKVVLALGQQDTAGLAALALTRAEFAYLYYPTARQGLPPYSLDPSLMWHLLVQRSDRGIRRALALQGRTHLRAVGYECGARASHEGANRIWGPCEVRATNARGDTIRLGLSQIIERDGQYKVLSYANQL